MPVRPTTALLIAAALAAPFAALAQSPRATSMLAESTEDPSTLIRLAESAIQAGRFGQATELLERAEARLLTRSELASEADRPAMGGIIGDLAGAREALARRDRAGAQPLMASALRRLERGGSPSVASTPYTPPPTTSTPMMSGALPAPAPSATGSTATPAPALGGGAAQVLQPVPTMQPPPWQPAPLQPAPAGGIAPQNMPVGGTASPPVPIGPDMPWATKAAPLPGEIPPASAKAPPQ